MTDHLTFETLCDLADAALASEDADRARAHLASCAECAGSYASLTSLTTAAASLPRAIAPPDGLWADIRREIAPAASRPVARIASMQWLAAAAVVIAIASSGITFLVMRGRAPETVIARSTVVTPSQPELPARLASTEVRYNRDVDVLLRTLAERRDSLAPSTVATIERSLRVADSAIAEARAALATDPSNAALAALFASNYERKIDLLKRASELTPRT